MSNGTYQLYDFVNSGGTINKVSQSVGGIYKVPFAIDAKGREVSQDKAKKYYLACRAIDDKLKLLKNEKRIYSTFFGQVFYFIEIKEQLKMMLASVEGIFFIYLSVFMDWPQPYFCPSCNGEVLFDYRKAGGYRTERTYFSHKLIFCMFSEETIETIKNRNIVDNYKVEYLNSFINTTFTKEIFLQKLRELKRFIGKVELNVFDENEIERILCNVPKKTSAICDFLEETEKHLRAKWYIVKAINENKEIFLLRRCSKCKKIGKQFFPVKQRQASIEYILPAGQCSDVAILDDNNNLTAVIEIFDEKMIDEKKEKALKDIPWGEISAETILGGNEWLVKRDNFKPYVCKDCKNAQVEEMFPLVIQPPEPSTKGRIRFESENYFFYMDLLLKEEFRIPRKMTQFVVKELNEFFYFKVTEILVFNTDGSADIIYRAKPDIKLPPDEDTMWVLSFILNGGWINIVTIGNNEFKERDLYGVTGIKFFKSLDELPYISLPYGFEHESPQKINRDHWQNQYSYSKKSSLSKLLSVLSRFFLMSDGKEISNIKYWEYKYKKNESKRYRKKKGTIKYSIPHENAYGSDIEAKLGEALIKENINFNKQYEIYTDGTLLTVTDFYIESGKIAIYCDGFKYHYNKESVIKDRNQDRALQFLGYKVLRYTGSEIVGNLDKCVREIKGFINKFSSINCR